MAGFAGSSCRSVPHPAYRFPDRAGFCRRRLVPVAVRASAPGLDPGPRRRGKTVGWWRSAAWTADARAGLTEDVAELAAELSAGLEDVSAR